jgi:hypothetical protein
VPILPNLVYLNLDIDSERERMQLKGPSVFLVGASHTLQHEAEDEHSMQNANAYPAYQYPNPNRSIVLVII